MCPSLERRVRTHGSETLGRRPPPSRPAPFLRKGSRRRSSEIEPQRACGLFGSRSGRARPACGRSKSVRCQPPRAEALRRRGSKPCVATPRRGARGSTSKMSRRLALKAALVENEAGGSRTEPDRGYRGWTRREGAVATRQRSDSGPRSRPAAGTPRGRAHEQRAYHVRAAPALVSDGWRDVSPLR